MGGRGSKGKPAGAAAAAPAGPTPGAPVDPKFKEGQTLASNPTYSAISNAVVPKGGAYSPARVDYEQGKIQVRLRDSGVKGATRNEVIQRMRARTESMLGSAGNYKINWTSDVRGTVVHG